MSWWKELAVLVMLSATVAGCASVDGASPGGASASSAVDEQLRDAAWANDVPRVTDLVQQGADVNDKDSWNGTGLIRAAERGHGAVVGRLLQAGIDRDHVNRIGYQAVHEAVWFGEDTEGYVDTLRVLVTGGVELDRPSEREQLTPLQMARERGFPELESVLASATSATAVAAPNVELFAAAAEGDADRVALSLRAGASIETRDDRGRTALDKAALADHGDTVRLLVASGASTGNP